MTSRVRTAAAITVGTVLLLSLPVGAAAADKGGAPSQLTWKGQPLSRVVRIDPMAPLVAFEPGPGSFDAQAGDVQQTDDGGDRGGSRRKSVLIGGAAGVGAGLFMGGAACSNEGGWGCPYTGLGGLVGFAIGAGIGAVLGN